MPLGKESHAAIKNSLEGLAIVDERLLQAYLVKRKAVSGTIVSSHYESAAPTQIQQKALAQTSAWRLSVENQNALAGPLSN